MKKIGKKGLRHKKGLKKWEKKSMKKKQSDRISLDHIFEFMRFKRHKREKQDMMLYQYQNTKYESIEKLLSRAGYCLNVKKISSEFKLLEKLSPGALRHAAKEIETETTKSLHSN